MIRQSKCNLNWIDPELDKKISSIFKGKYSSYIDDTIVDLLTGADISVNNESRCAMLDIIQYGLSESRFGALHATIFMGPAEFRGVYRQIVMVAGDTQFVDAWNIPDEMRDLFTVQYDTPLKILYWMIESLGRIHPFIDMNRRTIFLAADAQMLFLGMSPVFWSRNRYIWEDAIVYSQGKDAKKRLQGLMESIALL